MTIPKYKPLTTCPLCHAPIAYSTVGHKPEPPPNPICQSGAWYHVKWRGDDWVIFWVKGAPHKAIDNSRLGYARVK